LLVPLFTYLLFITEVKLIPYPSYFSLVFSLFFQSHIP
jgi:hypothetical protein